MVIATHVVILADVEMDADAETDVVAVVELDGD